MTELRYSDLDTVQDRQSPQAIATGLRDHIKANLPSLVQAALTRYNMTAPSTAQLTMPPELGEARAYADTPVADIDFMPHIQVYMSAWDYASDYGYKMRNYTGRVVLITGPAKAAQVEILHDRISEALISLFKPPFLGTVIGNTALDGLTLGEISAPGAFLEDPEAEEFSTPVRTTQIELHVLKQEYPN